MPLEIRKRFGRPFLELWIVTALSITFKQCDRVLMRRDLLGDAHSRPGNRADGLWPGSELQHQRVSPVVALALALLLSRGIAASAMASARAFAKQL
jgi:hypothetical protein